jgi:hypothetical protein
MAKSLRLTAVLEGHQAAIVYWASDGDANVFLPCKGATGRAQRGEWELPVKGLWMRPEMNGLFEMKTGGALTRIAGVTSSRGIFAW